MRGGDRRDGTNFWSHLLFSWSAVHCRLTAASWVCVQIASTTLTLTLELRAWGAPAATWYTRPCLLGAGLDAAVLNRGVNCLHQNAVQAAQRELLWL